jgi:alpha-glucosidase
MGTTGNQDGAEAVEKPRRWRRILRRSLVGLLVVLLLVAGLGFVGYKSLPADELEAITTGQLRVDAAALGTHRADRLQVRLGEGGKVEVRAPSDGKQRLVWANQPGRAFLTAAAGSVDWEEHRGYFWPSVDLTGTWPDQRIETVRARGGRVVVSGVLTDADGGTVPFEATFEARRAGGVRLEVSVDDDKVDAVGFVTGRTATAGVHGFGEQFDDFDLSGRLIPLVDREQGVGRGEQPLTLLADMTQHGAGGTAAMTYAALPRFVTDDLRGVRLAPKSSASTAFAVADTRNPRRVGLDVWSRTLDLELTAAATPQRLVTEQSGPVSYPQLAGWTQRGLIVGVQGGTERVRSVVQRLQRAGVKLAGVWIQDWTGQRTTGFGDRLWWTWQLDPQRYPGWAKLVHDLAKKGIRTTTYVNPFLVDAPARPGRNLWQEARQRGFLVRGADGDPYRLDQGGFDASLVDLSNPEARRWYARMIARYVLADGVVGFMADFGEGLPMDAELHSGAARRLHNAWPRLWAQTVRESCRLAKQPDCVTWFRSGSPGMAQLAPMMWTGDQLVDYGAQDGLASALLGTFSAGVSGWPLVHSDLGGYTSVDAVVEDYVRSPELLARWGEVAAFGVMMRSHEGNRPAKNRQVYDAGELAATARNSTIFAALRSYRARVLARAESRGIPAVRHVWLNDPHSAAAQRDDEFMLGDAVLVAPVLAEGVDTVRVTFPPGKGWVNLFTNEVYRGGETAVVDAPPGQPAAFVDVGYPRWIPLLERFRRAGLLQECRTDSGRDQHRDQHRSKDRGKDADQGPVCSGSARSTDSSSRTTR